MTFTSVGAHASAPKLGHYALMTLSQMRQAVEGSNGSTKFATAFDIAKSTSG